jgi:ammonia channel protein AmtB
VKKAYKKIVNWAFACTSATIVAGTVGKLQHNGNRPRLSCGSPLDLEQSGVPICHCTRSFPRHWVIDFSGSWVVQIMGGTTALIAAWFLGPRASRFHDDSGRPLPVPKLLPPNSIAFQMLVTSILWFGWYGFNPGSTRTITGGRDYTAALTTILIILGAASESMLYMFVRSFIGYYCNGEVSYDLHCVMDGHLSGLVANTAGCAVNLMLLGPLS